MLVFVLVQFICYYFGEAPTDSYIFIFWLREFICVIQLLYTLAYPIAFSLLYFIGLSQ